jgi:hypothetical protein
MRTDPQGWRQKRDRRWCSRRGGGERDEDRRTGCRSTHLDERLNLAPTRELLRAHTLGDLKRVALDAGDDRVGVGALLRALVHLLDDDDLVAGLTTLENDGDLSCRTKGADA